MDIFNILGNDIYIYNYNIYIRLYTSKLSNDL